MTHVLFILVGAIALGAFFGMVILMFQHFLFGLGIMACLACLGICWIVGAAILGEI